MQMMKAGVLYFALVFGAGFVLGPIRILWAVPTLFEVFLPLFISLNREKLNIKDQGCIRPDLTPCTQISVTKIRRDIEQPLRSFLHERQGFGQARNDLFNFQNLRLPAKIRIREFRSH